MARVAKANIVERRLTRFLREPPSVRLAVSVIVAATGIVVVAGGVLIRVLDHSEYSDVWTGMWYALQTVTTVGYGDVTPEKPAGRIVGAVIMLQGIAFVTIIVAAITSTFVARAAKERQVELDEVENTAEARIEARLDRIEQSLARLESQSRK